MNESNTTKEVFEQSRRRYVDYLLELVRDDRGLYTVNEKLTSLRMSLKILFKLYQVQPIDFGSQVSRKGVWGKVSAIP